MKVQQSLFLSREEKQELLDEAQFLISGSTPRTSRAVKRLLWAIETLPESSRTKPILAARMECSARNCARVIRAAESLGVLHTVAAPGDASYYFVDWPAIARLEKQMSPVTSKCHPCHPNVTRDIQMSRVTFPKRTVTTSATEEESTTCDEKENRHADCVAGAGAMNVMNGLMNDSLNPPNHSFIHPSHSISNDPPRAAQRGGGLGPGGWPERITRDTLRSVEKINDLWLFALGRGWGLTPDDREGFFALAGHIGLTVKEQDNPGGKFTNRVKLRDWSAAPLKAWEAARTCISRLERDLAERQAQTKAQPQSQRSPK